MNLWLSLSTVEKSCARLVLIEIALFKPMFTMDTYMIGSLSSIRLFNVFMKNIVRSESLNYFVLHLTKC